MACLIALCKSIHMFCVLADRSLVDKDIDVYQVFICIMSICIVCSCLVCVNVGSPAHQLSQESQLKHAIHSEKILCSGRSKRNF